MLGGFHFLNYKRKKAEIINLKMHKFLKAYIKMKNVLEILEILKYKMEMKSKMESVMEKSA